MLHAITITLNELRELEQRQHDLIAQGRLVTLYCPEWHTLVVFPPPKDYDPSRDQSICRN